MADGALTVFLCGDVMLGRGVDQILPHPGDPRLYEPSVTDARGYVELAEEVNGPVPRPVDFGWPWGAALEALDAAAPDVRIVNLETSITRSDDVALGKRVHYRMSPDNLPCLLAARPDVCVLANNHVLDFGTRGLLETLDVLADANLVAVGAGRDDADAKRPVTIEAGGRGRVVVVAVGTSGSGIPASWAAGPSRPGVALLPDLSDRTADRVLARVDRGAAPGEVVVVSIHWGSNWGYHVPREQVRFAHRLVEGGVDVVHGHSSHHPRPIEVYRGRLVLYGCGDTINDYEGIAGYEGYRSDLRLLYLASVAPGNGELVRLRMVPLQARNLRLHPAARADGDWLCEALAHASRPFGSGVERAADGWLDLRAPVR